jgi:hypothetical protein
MAGRYNQAGTVLEEVRPYKLAGRLQLFTQLLNEEETSSSEENTSKGREESTTVDFAIFRGEYQQGKRGVNYCGLCQAKQ